MAEPLSFLVVEDSDEDFEAMRRIFTRLGVQHAINRCKSGDEALTYLQSQPCPSLCFLDLNLPGTDGRAVLTAIKSNERLKCIPVLVFTSSEHPDDVTISYKAGANTYLLKPSCPNEFEEVINQIRKYWLGKNVILPQVQRA